MTKILNRNLIKYLCIILMTLDHLTLINHNLEFNIVSVFYSRIVCPIMIYFIVDGYFYTKDLKAYLKRLLLFGFISWFCFSFYYYNDFLPIRLINGIVSSNAPSLVIGNHTLIIHTGGVIMNLFLCLLLVGILDRLKYSKIINILISIMFFYLSLFFDWGGYCILFTLIFYYFRDKKLIKWILYTLTCVLYLFNMDIDPLGLTINFSFNFYAVGCLLIIPIIEVLYNNKSGIKNKFNKYFFYIYYPLHLVIIRLISYYL